ncbi:MAG: M28 family peptidase [Myxococcota bacterium]|nr:M28 family peptidase [Myxococcota bacterium]
MRIGLPHLFFGFVFCTSLGCEALRPAPEAGPDVAPGMSAPEAGSSSSGVVASPSAFEASRAWSDLEVLAAGPRRTGTEGAERARTYIREQFAALGLEVHEQALDIESPGQEPLRVTNLVAVVPGASSDLILLLAPYDSRHYESFEHVGANDGASGAAVLLELARVISAEPLSFTTWFVFLDGEAPFSAAEDTLSFAGSRVFAALLDERSAVEQVRLAVFLNRVCDSDLKLVRDLGSHRLYREEFWNAAGRLGHGEAFSRETAFESPDASHGPLAHVGLRRVVALVDTSHGGGVSPGPYSGTEDDDLEHCSEQSLGVVGSVTLAGLSTISERLARLDRFSDSSVSDAEPLRPEHLSGVEDGAEAPEPAAAEAAEPAAAEAPEPAAAEAAEPAAAEAPEPAAAEAPELAAAEAPEPAAAEAPEPAAAEAPEPAAAEASEEVP